MSEVEKILIFGAGKIGRSFIGQLFGRADYEVIFIEENLQLVNLLNERRAYWIHVRDSQHPELEESIEIKNVRALHTSESASILNELKETKLVATSVGKVGLPGVAWMLREGIKQRFKEFPERPLDVILAENIRHAALRFRSLLKYTHPDSLPYDYIGLVETSIGKMVPIMTGEQLQSDPLAIYTEPYNELILDKLGFRNSIPDVKGLSPKEHVDAWVDRKLFIHNLGHAALAYLAYFRFPEMKYTWEALKNSNLKTKVRDTMLQSAKILQQLHPTEFTKEELETHVDDLLARFANKALGDTIYRVGCDLERKLGRDDRLMVPIVNASSMNLPFDLILEVWMKGCEFAARDEHGEELEQDRAFRQKYGRDYQRILNEHCGLNNGLILGLMTKVREFGYST